MKHFPFLLITCVAFTLTVGCSTPQSGGYVIDDPTQREPLYKLRFDGNGELIDPGDLAAVCRKLAAKPQTVMVFIHGWHGSAKPNDNNVRKFAEALNTVRTRSYRQSGRTLTGVYLTWPARYLPDPFEELAWYSTRARADSTARGRGVPMAIDALSKAARRDKGDRFVIAGHSLGARILGRVIGSHPELLRDIDLCILANTADGADQYEKTLLAVTKSGTPPSHLPKLVWATSAHDHVTGVLYPLANGHKPPGFKHDMRDYTVTFVDRDASGHYSAAINRVARQPNWPDPQKVDMT